MRADREVVRHIDEPLRSLARLEMPGNVGATDRVVSIRAATISETQESEP
jgi:hypothetical protein